MQGHLQVRIMDSSADSLGIKPLGVIQIAIHKYAQPLLDGVESFLAVKSMDTSAGILDFKACGWVRNPGRPLGKGKEITFVRAQLMINGELSIIEVLMSESPAHGRVEKEDRSRSSSIMVGKIM